MLNTMYLRLDLYNNIYFCKVRKCFVINASKKMELNTTIDIIIKDLNEARDIIDDLKKYPGVPELQVELAKAKCKSAAEVIALFKTLSPAPPLEKDTKPEKAEESHKEKAPEPVKTVREYHPPVVEKKVEEVVAGPEPEEVMVPSEPVVKTAPVSKKPAETAIIADKFSQPASFNEELGSHKHGDDVLEIIRTMPVTSLVEAIGINDKFLFVREIFNGNQDVYNQALQKLESAGSLSDARAIIAGYTGEDNENEAVRQLMDLIKRKFPQHE